MTLRFFNTLGRELQDFKPNSDNQVGLYSCGPTVYHYAHIGNLRAYIFSDTVRRSLEYFGYNVKQVINITDVGHLISDADEGEDKIEKQATLAQKTVSEIVDFYTEAFRKDLESLNIKTISTEFPRATDHISEQIQLIEKLETGGYTYKTSDGIYFDTSRYQDYPELAKLDLEGLKEGARVEANPEKKSPTDFALWKFSKPEEKRQQEWGSPWGVGFPGWHIECSAMSMKYLGETFDIHTGGVDLIPTHHTNERAQSECATGKPFVHFWLHAGHILINEKKMSKSDGNIIRLEELSEVTGNEISPLAYRYWILTAHYRTTINLNSEALTAAQNAYDKLVTVVAEGLENKGQVLSDWQEKFKAKLADDLNTPEAIAVVWSLIKDPAASAADKTATILDFDEVLGLDLENRAKMLTAPLPEDVQKLVAEREEARAKKDFSTSDSLRQKVEASGYEIKDSETGPIVRKKV